MAYFNTLIGEIDNIDRELTLLLNFDGGLLFDAFWWAISSKLIWVPIALAFMYFLIKKYRNAGAVAIFILGLILTITLCDQISSSIIKPLCMRLRPSHTPGLSEQLHYVNNYFGGRYGFVSSHAANAFGACIYASILIKRRTVTLFLSVFALCVCYSRIYLGVHYLGDVIAGAALGLLTGYIICLLAIRLKHYFFPAPAIQSLDK